MCIRDSFHSLQVKFAYQSQRITVSAASGRYQLRSTGSAAYVLRRTRTKFGECGFFYSGPAAWNTLPLDLHDITDTSTFRKRLKNVLFDRAYNGLLLALLDESYSGALQISRWLIDWLIKWLNVWLKCDWNLWVVTILVLTMLVVVMVMVVISSLCVYVCARLRSCSCEVKVIQERGVVRSWEVARFDFLLPHN